MENIIDYGSVTVPKNWDELTLKKYQDIEKYYEDKEDNFNVIDVLDILIDKDRDYIQSLPAEFLDTILTHLVFLSTTPEVGEPTNKIVIDGEEYSINFMKKLKVGEYVAVDTVLKADKHDYSSILAILCRKKDEIYDSRFEAEEFEKRKEMFEKQSVTKILPIIGFFMKCFIISQLPSQLSLKVEEAIDHTVLNIENLRKSGEVSKLSTIFAIRKLKKLKKSIKSI